VSRILLLLLCCAGCAAPDLGYIQVELHELAAGDYALVAYADPALLRSLAPPQVPDGFTVSDRDRDQTRRSFAVHGPRPLDHRDLIELPWPRSGALLSVHWADGSQIRVLLPRSGATIRLQLAELGAGAAAWTSVFSDYLRLGIGHILGGIDHLLFVFGLLLLIRSDPRAPRPAARLVATITAFTLGHSVTLAAATLGLATPSAQVVEPLITLSIAVLAAEIWHARAGRPGCSARWPWLVATGFGLLHGFGFAGALQELGLPRGELPLALVGFNLGVELGQVLFVALILLAARALAPVLAAQHQRILPPTIYALGIIAATWTLDRSWTAFAG